jgi:hypothetical protein
MFSGKAILRNARNRHLMQGGSYYGELHILSHIEQEKMLGKPKTDSLCNKTKNIKVVGNIVTDYSK